MARKTAAPNDKALDAFLAAKTEIDRLLAELASLSADHFHTSPDEITWSHVGSANHIRERLLSADDAGDHAIEPMPPVEVSLEQGPAAATHGPAVRFPLQVRFYQTEGQRRSVDHLEVKDLGMVSGEPASVAHALKPVFDEDRNLGRPIDDCRYTLAKNITTTKKMSVAAVTKNIQRCRKELAEFYLAMEGIPPAEPLLIQSHGPKGYRLDPTIRVIT